MKSSSLNRFVAHLLVPCLIVDLSLAAFGPISCATLGLGPQKGGRYGWMARPS